MKSISEELPMFQQMITLIANQFGPKCEVVLHDLTKDYTNTIVDIRNGHITNRSIGGCGSNLGLEVLRGSAVDGDRFNYVTTMPDGRMLRSSSIYIKNDEGQVIGSICINFDITETLHFEGYLRQFNHFNPSEQEEEVFATDVTNLLQHLIAKGQEQIGKAAAEMNKEERIAFIHYLDQKGAFLITKSSEQICELLCISKFTFYNYLEVSRRAESSGTATV